MVKKEVKQAPPGDAKVSTVSAEGSRSNPAPVPSAAPLPSGGKYTPLAPAPGTLEWGCTPTALHTWFQAWKDFWHVNRMGNTASEMQLLNLVKVNLSEEWHSALNDFDWSKGSMQSLYTLMDLKFEIY